MPRFLPLLLLSGLLVAEVFAADRPGNTIVVLWSDHGWHLGEKLTFRKFTLWEEACRVPMIVALPKSIRGGYQQGTDCARTVNLIDLYPTLVELCGLKAPRQQLDGHSLVPLLQDASADWRHGSITSDGIRKDSIRTERWRFTRYANGAEELYDHDKDPNEWTNLAGDSAYSKTVAALREKLPKNHAPLVKTDPFDFRSHSQKYHKEFRDKKLIERIKKD